MTTPRAIATAAMTVALAATAANAQFADPDIVFENSFDNGFFVPFNSSNTNVRYGDSGWITGSGAGAPVQLTEITLGLIVAGDAPAGSTDLTFTFNDGDPSGLVFGPGTELFSTTIPNVQLPETTGDPIPLSITIPLPNILTSGGFNNIGWSVGVENFNYGGDFGFQTSSASGQTTGFFTNNASFFDGSSWSLFSFGSDPNTGVANFVATVKVPAPASAALLGLAGAAATRRRR